MATDWSKYRLSQEVLDSNIQYIDSKTGKIIFYSGFEEDRKKLLETGEIVKRNTITCYI